jgi:hypothetical protein
MKLSATNLIKAKSTQKHFFWMKTNQNLTSSTKPKWCPISDEAKTLKTMPADWLLIIEQQYHEIFMQNKVIKKHWGCVIGISFVN